jgi:hypothetical protein
MRIFFSKKLRSPSWLINNPRKCILTTKKQQKESSDPFSFFNKIRNNKRANLRLVFSFPPGLLPFLLLLIDRSGGAGAVLEEKRKH